MIPLAAVLLGGAPLQAATPVETRTLSASQILQQVVGHTIEFQNDKTDQVYQYLAADGSVHGWLRVSGTSRSEWQIRFGHYLCLVSADPMDSGCVRVRLLPHSRVEFQLDIGEKEGPFRLIRGNPRHL